MPTFNFPLKKNISILALGAESAGNFSVYYKNKLFLSDDFGDLLEEKNWKNYQKKVLKYLKDNKIKPKIILTDLHPLYKTTSWGKTLAKKYKTKHIQVQHHHAHVFSTIGDKILHNIPYLLPPTFYGFAMDGTGYGTDGKIWGGEIFRIESGKYKIVSIKRTGYLENQIMIGGDLAVREPARMLLGVLSNILSNKKIYPFVKKYYTKNEFELLSNQLAQKFNCLETSSVGRILDAISLLLGFCDNERNYKHEPIDLLEKNSTKPYSGLKPKIIFDNKEKKYILDTKYLFNYIISAIGGSASGGSYLHNRDKRRLAATAQFYIAQGLYEIIKKQKNNKEIFISGGLANNKIISNYLISKGAYVSKKIPRGDAGLSFGQVIYYLLTNPRD